MRNFLELFPAVSSCDRNEDCLFPLFFIFLQVEHADRTLSFIPAVAKEMDRWIEKGHGQDDWTIIAKDNI